jgi:SOS-response transcriptional repressor LexA
VTLVRPLGVYRLDNQPPECASCHYLQHGPLLCFVAYNYFFLYTNTLLMENNPVFCTEWNHLMPTHHTLQTTLQQVIKARHHNSHSLAMASGVAQPVIYRILHGHTQNPKVLTLLALAHSLNVSLEQLMGITPWQTSSPDLMWIPHIHATDLNHWSQAHTMTNQWIPLQNTAANKQCFATSLWDDTMAPAFAENSIIIIDPQRQAQHHDHVLVQSNKGWLFRQYLSDQHHHLLKAKNNDFPAKPMQTNDHIIGVAIEYRCCL